MPGVRGPHHPRRRVLDLPRLRMGGLRVVARPQASGKTAGGPGMSPGPSGFSEDPMFWVSLKDIRLPAWGAAVFEGSRETDYQEHLAFARLLASAEEARALRHALREGDKGMLIPHRIPFVLHPETRVREERIWIKGIPRVRVTLYLPALAGAGIYFWVGSSASFYEFVEAATPFPVPAPERRADPGQVGAGLMDLARISSDRVGDPRSGSDPLRALARAARAVFGDAARRALLEIQDGLFPMTAIGMPGEWVALAIREAALMAILRLCRIPA